MAHICFGVKFSNIHPASESGFLPGIFLGGESIVMQISFVMLIFLLFSNQFFGRGKFPEQIALGKASSQSNNVSKHRNELFSKETLQILVLYVISYYKYVENIKTRINFLDKRQIS